MNEGAGNRLAGGGLSGTLDIGTALEAPTEHNGLVQYLANKLLQPQCFDAIGWMTAETSINQSINQSNTFARAPVTDEHWRRTSNLINLVT